MRTFYYIFCISFLLFSCSNFDSKEDNLEYDESKTIIDTIGRGERLFKENCIACHHRLSQGKQKIEGTKLKVVEIKKILSDTINHNGLSFLNSDEIALIKHYLNQGPLH